MAGGAETPNIAALPAIARLGACESARGADADRRVKLLIQFAVEGSLSGAYSHMLSAKPFFGVRPQSSAQPPRPIDPGAVPERSSVHASRETISRRFIPARRLETSPSRPMLQAARKRSGPISPCSNGLTKMPSGLPRSSRARFALRIDSGRSRKSSPSSASRSNTQSCTSSSCLRECSALKSATPHRRRHRTRSFSAARWRLRSLFCVGLALDPLRVGQGQ